MSTRPVTWFRAALSDNLPVGILAGDFFVLERIEITAAYLDLVSGEGGPGQKPFRHAGVVVGEMFKLRIMDIRRGFETRAYAAADVVDSLISGAVRFRTARQVEAAILGEVRHDPVEVVLVERFSQTIYRQ